MAKWSNSPVKEAAFRPPPNVGDIRSGKGLLAAVEFVEDRVMRTKFASDRTIVGRLEAEMMKRGVVTMAPPTAGAHPAPVDAAPFAPPPAVAEAEIDPLFTVSAEPVKAWLGA